MLSLRPWQYVKNDLSKTSLGPRDGITFVCKTDLYKRKRYKTKVACYELELKEQPNVYNCLL